LSVLSLVGFDSNFLPALRIGDFSGAFGTMSPVPTFDDRIRGADDAFKLTVENAFDLRARSDVMPTSVAPACSSDMFKSPV
jgi:hypothetical protein